MKDSNGSSIPERTEYGTNTLEREDLLEDPIELFDIWFEGAVAAGVPEPNGFCLCTADPEVGGEGRILLMKGYGVEGFSFFTNYESDKARQLGHESRASMVFWWQALRRQVRIRGQVEKLPGDASDEYFSTRPRSSQLGAWASKQSTAVGSRLELQNRYEEAESQFPDSVTRPPFWGGYLLRPEKIEFWQGRNSRLHDRFVYRWSSQRWDIERLMP